MRPLAEAGMQHPKNDREIERLWAGGIRPEHAAAVTAKALVPEGVERPVQVPGFATEESSSPAMPPRLARAAPFSIAASCTRSV